MVDWVRRGFHIAKVGHTGTLDPLATGVLVLCLGKATRLSAVVSAQDKRYRAEIRLGARTDTFDAEGTVTDRSDRIPKDLETVSEVVRAFVGEIEQVPPMFSARKVSGQRLYRLARSGQEVPRQSRKVWVFQADIKRFTPPLLELDVHCSKGTYIRVLADDIGRELGCGAHLCALRRLAVGEIGLDSCVTVERLREIQREGRLSLHVMSPNQILGKMPGVCLTPTQMKRFSNGNPVADVRVPPGEEAGTLVRALDGAGELWGIGQWAPGEAVLQPVRVLRTQEGKTVT